MILTCIQKWNKNVFASQADIIITNILLHSLENHKKYDALILLTFDWLIAYLEKNKIYKQGVFRELELMEECFQFSNSSEEVRAKCNHALAEIILVSSIETVESKQEELVQNSFLVLNNLVGELGERNLLTSEGELNDNFNLGISALKVLQAIAQRFQGTMQEKHAFLTLILNYLEEIKWVPWNYWYKIALFCVQGKDSLDNDLILYDNLTQIFIMLYK